jgi:hypothetical protein
MASPEPRIASLDHLDNGAVIRFDDGKSAFFSASLLYRLLPEAKAMPSSKDGFGSNTEFLDDAQSGDG